MSMQADGEKLIGEAQRIFDRDVQAALRDRDYNMVIRRAQEVVELSLKGALKVLGVDYPRVHDVAPAWSEQVRRKVAHPVSDETLERLEAISLWLSQARTLSFYFERGYSEEDAGRAFTDAAVVLTEIREILGKYIEPKDSAPN